MHWSLGEREIIGRKKANVDSDIPYYKCFYTFVTVSNKV